MTSIPDPCAHSRDSYPGSGPGGGVQPCDPAAQGGHAEEDLAARALASQRVRKFLDGEPAKIVVRAPRLVNIVP